MRIPSTSDLCHSQANKAYDKLAVISDNIEELKAIYDFIFDVQEYFRHLLKQYSIKDKDEEYKGEKKLLKGIKTNKISIFNSIDIMDDLAFIETGYEDHNPYLLLHIDRYIDDIQDTVTGAIKLTIDLDKNKPIFTIPPTDENIPQSAVRLDYLNQVIENLNSLIDALDVRVTDLENALGTLANKISGIEARLNALEGVNLLDTVQENKPDAVKSSGIYAFVKAIEQDLRNLIGTVDGKAYPIGSKTQKGIVQVGEGIDVNQGIISVDLETLATLVGGGEETEIGDDTWRVWRSGKLALVRVPDISSLLPSEEREFTSPVEFVERIAIFQSSNAAGYIAVDDNVTVKVYGNSIKVSHSINHPAGVMGINILGWIR